MTGTAIELNRPLQLRGDVFPSNDLSRELIDAQDFYRSSDGKIAGLSDAARNLLAIPSALILTISSIMGLAFLYHGAAPHAALLSIPVSGALLGWSIIPGEIWELKMKRKRKKLSGKIAKTTAVLSGWLQENYGMRFGRPEEASMVAEALLGVNFPIYDRREFTMLTRDGMRIQARLMLTDQGLLELRKASATDANESPYFTPLREELS